MQVAGLFMAAGGILGAQAPSGTGLEEGEILIQPYLERVPLGDGISAYPKGNTYVVPFGEICRLLGFGILLEPGGARAAGFFISEKRSFLLDARQGWVEVEGRRSALPRDGIFRKGQDIYVDYALLQAWFPLEVNLNLKSAVLMIKPKEKLPLQAEWERENRFGSQQNAGVAGEALPVGIYVPTPYAFAEMPFMDVALAWSMSQHGSASPMQGAVASGGDLLWMSSNLYLVKDQDGSFKSSRGTLFREDPQGGLLGPLHAQRVALGDILQAPSLDLAGDLPQGRGFLLDNYPMAYRSRFATRTFKGNLPDGWSVECFQNGALVAFSRSRADGLYEPDLSMPGAKFL